MPISIGDGNEKEALVLMEKIKDLEDKEASRLMNGITGRAILAARKAAGALSVCYCHTPMRYVWDRFDDYFGTKPAPVRALAQRIAAIDLTTEEKEGSSYPSSTSATESSERSAARRR